MKEHCLKTWSEYYWRIASGQKKFEVRKNDRDYQVGDRVVLQEYDPQTTCLSGNHLRFNITYILHGGQFGIEPGYCVFGIEPMEAA